MILGTFGIYWRCLIHVSFGTVGRGSNKDGGNVAFAYPSTSQGLLIVQGQQRQPQQGGSAKFCSPCYKQNNVFFVHYGSIHTGGYHIQYPQLIHGKQWDIFWILDMGYRIQDTGYGLWIRPMEPKFWLAKCKQILATVVVPVVLTSAKTQSDYLASPRAHR